MALSDWDTLAFGPDGQPRAGLYINPANGASVEIYKNWLYVRDEKAWYKENGPFARPIVMQISEGRLDYGGLQIVAVRHKAQRAVFALVSWSHREGDLYKREHFGGIGCCAYINEVDWYLLYKPDQLREVLEDQGAGWLFELLQKNAIEYWTFATNKTQSGQGWTQGIALVGYDQNGNQSDQGDQSTRFWLPEGDPDTLVGVEQSTYEAWLQWAGSEFKGDKSGLAWLEKVRASEPLRYNQGDALLAGSLGEKTPATPLGEQEPPFLIRALQGDSPQTAIVVQGCQPPS